MCGIFGYVGNRTDAGEIVLEGLKHLEYRGYDSWGIAVQQDNKAALSVKKDIGTIQNIEAETLQLPEGTIAMGHTRWATHGGVLWKNAHPHMDTDQRIAVVHNGIIENHQELKVMLKKKGYTFVSDTDTEVIPQLIRDYIDQGSDFETAVRLTLNKMTGRYAIVALLQSEKKLIAARRGSPLIIGIGTDEYFVASDVPAFLSFTKQVNYLDDGEMVTITNDGLAFKRIEKGEPVTKRMVTIKWDIEEAEKGEHPHFMIKEIREQKETINRAINQDPALIRKLVTVIRDAYGVFFVGCGTAGKVCMAASYAFSEIAQRHVNAVFGSEFRSYHHFLKKKGLFIAISQSGETADTLEALEVATAKGMTTIAVVNVEGSTMARESRYVLPLKVGPEKAVASTKATTAQLALVLLLAYGLADRYEEGLQVLMRTATGINDMLNPRYEDHIFTLAQKLYERESMYVIGKGINYPIALEAAIKIQEVSYIHAEGFAGGELKHGPLALIGEGTPAIVLVAHDDTEQDILNNAIEIKARGGYIIGVSPTNNETFDYWLRVPDVGGMPSSIVNIIPIQILAYHMSVLRGFDPDRPRNLAKAVTVK